jgi:hypothetical protein
MDKRIKFIILNYIFWNIYHNRNNFQDQTSFPTVLSQLCRLNLNPGNLKITRSCFCFCYAFSLILFVIDQQIDAHQSPLATMAFSSNGMYLATASEKGTMVRVHIVAQATKVNIRGFPPLKP